MMGKCLLNRRHWHSWWCCAGHDGTKKQFVDNYRTSQRSIEKRQWREEYVA